MFASSSSFMLLVVRRLHRNVTVIFVSVNWSAENVQNRSSILLWHSCYKRLFRCNIAFLPVWSLTSCHLFSDNSLKIFEIRKWFTPSFVDTFLQDIPNWVISRIQIWRMRCPFLWATEIGRVVSKKILSCFGAVWWSAVLHEDEIIVWILVLRHNAAFINDVTEIYK